MAGQSENLVTGVPKETQLSVDWDKRFFFEQRIKPLVTPKVVEEHKKNPIGLHSDGLERILIFMRRHEYLMTNKYVIVCTKPHEKWCIGMLSGIRGIGPKILTDERFGSRLEAEHGVFLKRLKDWGLD